MILSLLFMCQKGKTRNSVQDSRTVLLRFHHPIAIAVGTRGCPQWGLQWVLCYMMEGVLQRRAWIWDLLNKNRNRTICVCFLWIFIMPQHQRAVFIWFQPITDPSSNKPTANRFSERFFLHIFWGSETLYASLGKNRRYSQGLCFHTIWFYKSKPEVAGTCTKPSVLSFCCRIPTVSFQKRQFSDHAQRSYCWFNKWSPYLSYRRYIPTISPQYPHDPQCPHRAPIFFHVSFAQGSRPLL